MKKILSWILSLVLLTSSGISAAAASDASESALNDRLKAITLSVKDALGIGDSFTSFSGTLNENGTASLWSLTWSKDGEQIFVSANENGRIVGYNDYISSSSASAYGKLPRFPKINMDEARAITETFLARVLNTKIETVELQGTGNLDYSGSAVFYLNGNVKLNGIESPINISVSVSAATKQVITFFRSDAGQDYSSLTKPTEVSDKAAAALALKSTLNMKMTYALSGDGSHTAHLQYLPYPGGSYVVDAVTGKLIDLNKLDYTSDPYSPQAKNDSTAAASGLGSSSITTVEQSTIDKMQGVLSKADLEKNIRAYTELGLTSDFKLQYLNYYTYEGDSTSKQTQVVANIGFTYTPQEDTSAVQYRYISINAKTGKLLSVSSSRLYTDTKTPITTFKYTSAQTEAVARSFIGKIMPDELKQTALSSDVSVPSGTDTSQMFSFYRTHDAISFPENYINVGVDADTGYVVSFNSNWYTYDVDFVQSTGIITAGTATDKFAAGVGTVLKYVHVPISTQATGLLLVYTNDNSTVWGVNASTGELLQSSASPDVKLEYSDIDSSPYASLIKQLAVYGVGFSGGAFMPDAQLTQEDALIIIESTNGYKITPLSGSASRDDLYSTAYAMGILTPSEKNPTQLVSRAVLAKYLVNALGYGDIAALPNIYKAGFLDDQMIAENLMGYVAIAKGLGIVHGDQNGSFKPNDTATRTTAAIMIYNCLSRK